MTNSLPGDEPFGDPRFLPLEVGPAAVPPEIEREQRRAQRRWWSAIPKCLSGWWSARGRNDLDRAQDELQRAPQVRNDEIQARANRHVAEARVAHAEADAKKQAAAKDAMTARAEAAEARVREIQAVGAQASATAETAERIADAVERVRAALERIREQGGDVGISGMDLERQLLAGLVEFPDDPILKEAEGRLFDFAPGDDGDLSAESGAL